MSLFNNAANGTLTGAVSGAIGLGGKQISGALGGVMGSKLGNALGGALSRAASKAVTRAIQRKLPRTAQVALGAGIGAIGDLQRGDFGGAAVRALDTGLLQNYLGQRLSGVDRQREFWSTPIPLLGGVSPKEAAAMVKRQASTKYAKQSLFLIEVSSDVDGDYSELFNFFAVSVSYPSFSITGNARHVGSHIYNLPQSTEPTELTITALDDDMGTIKYWFADHATAAARPDGTFGLPAEYAIRFKIVHAFCTEETAVGAYSDVGLFFPVSMSTEHSRREHEFIEVQMTFQQLDSMMG